MPGAVDQHDPGPAVLGVAGFGLVEHRGDDLLGGVVHRAAQPLGPGFRARATLLHGVGGVGDDVVDAADGGLGVVDGAQGGHPFAAVLLAGREPGRHLVAVFGCGGFRGGFAQRLGPYHHALAVGGQHQQRGVGARLGHQGLVERVDVGRGGHGEFLDLPVADAGAGQHVDAVDRLGEGAAGGLGRGEPGQPQAVHPGRHVQCGVGQVQIGRAGGSVGDPGRCDLPEHRGQDPPPAPLDPGALDTGRIDHRIGPLLAHRAQIQMVLEQLPGHLAHPRREQVLQP
uniref:hypothetical protein n=1 Tax=Streptomyces sp. TG1A-60 TaxID=3129111 RepID=UPI00404022CB